MSEWNIQQAYPIEKYKLQPGEWISISQKLNGVHGTAMDGKMISRQGKIMSGFENTILAELTQLGYKDWFVDGELICANIDGKSDEENFRRTTSIVNSKQDESKQMIDFYVYEILTKDEFENGCSLTYKERLKRLEEFERQAENCEWIRVVPRYYQGTDHSYIKGCLAATDTLGLEGCIVNRDTLYKRCRNNGVLKVKTWKHCDLKVIDVEEGKGKYKGKTGKLVVDYKGNKLRLSGMLDDERAQFWQHPEDIIGKIVLVKYKTESHNKKGEASLNFASYICVRADKDEPSYN